MRLLLFENPDDPFFLALEIPSVKVLTTLEAKYPKTANLFAEVDILNKRNVSVLLEEAKLFLTASSKMSKQRTAKSIEVRYANRDFVNGPAGGVTGFQINGVACSACVKGNGIEISWDEGDTTKSIFVTSERYPVEDGELVVHFRNGPSLYDFFSRLERSLASTKKSFIWSCVES